MNGSTVIGTGVVDSTGNFSIAVSPAPQDGASLTVSAADASGRTSPDATYNVIGTLPNLPDIPVITAINDDAAPLTGDVKAKPPMTSRLR